MKDRADNRIAEAIRVQREFGMKGDNWDNYAIAKGTLNDEMDYANEQRPYYELDEQTKDILVAHARQDAAHALANTASLLRRIKFNGRLMWLSIIINIVMGYLILTQRR